MSAAQPRRWRSHVPRSRLLRAVLILALFASACSGGGSATPTEAPQATTQAPPKPTPDQQTGTPAAVTNPAAQAATAPSGQAEQRAVQAGGDPGRPVAEPPTAHRLARST